jgi:hypothetical protein
MSHVSLLVRGNIRQIGGLGEALRNIVIVG